MRISDWSSDVCSSDLRCAAVETVSALRRSAHARGSWTFVPVRGLSRHRTGRRRLAGVPGTGRRGSGIGAIAGRRDWRGNWTTTGQRARPCRSEEHTSELQSLMRISYAVFCLKKKTTRNKTHKKYKLAQTTQSTKT